MDSPGRWFVAAGLLLVAAGLVLHCAPWLLQWFGRLPGDICVDSPRVKFFFPLTSMAVVSVVCSLLLYFFRR